ncbi:galactose-specific lectin nattectin isoform X1 [Lates calcarifer]|nr:galactose-specific lectin nattectin isoform X1 [Lates calcarifer]
MKTLTVSLIVCTLIALTRAAALPYEENEHGTMDPMIIVEPFPFMMTMTPPPPPPPLPEITIALPETTLPYEENEHGTMDPMIIVDPFPFMTTPPPPPPPETTTALPETREHRVVKRSTSCPCGWTEYYDRCFFYVSKAMSWADAQKNCETMNSNLASVHSDEEYQLIQKVVLVASHGSGPTWIGGSDAQKEKLWFWIDGTTFKYENWCEGQPDDFQGAQDCALMNFAANKCWDDGSCEAALPSVCAKKI